MPEVKEKKILLKKQEVELKSAANIDVWEGVLNHSILNQRSGGSTPSFLTGQVRGANTDVFCKGPNH